MSQKNIIAVLYHHSHGIDVNLYASWDLAHRETAQMCMENLDLGEMDQFDKCEKNKELIAQALEQKDYKKIVQLYSDISADSSEPEYFEFEERPLIEQ